MKYPRYPAYKDSGVEWIGEIPEYWNLVPFKWIISIIKGKVPKNIEPEFPETNDYLPYLSMEFLRGETVKQWVRIDNSTFVVNEGEILLLWDGSNAGEFIKSRKGILSSTVALISSNKVNHNFLFYFCKVVEHELKELTVGMGIPHVDGDILKSFSMPFPSNQEQIYIANFLNCRMTIIDRLISKEQQLIGLLKEKHQAIITHAVTNGLDPNVPMKDSGVEWIGEIPAHWEIKPLFSLMQEKKIKNIEDGNLEVLSLSYGNIVGREVANNFGLLPESFTTYQVVDKWNIILRLTDLQNDKNSLRVGQVKQKGIITSAYVCLQTSVDLIPEFAYFMLHSYDIRKVFYGFGGGVRQSMIFKDLKHLPIVYPAIDEQIQIIEHINTEIDKLDILILKQEELIELLIEYRTSIISNAVTGKIDVRGFAVPSNSNITEA